MLPNLPRLDLTNFASRLQPASAYAPFDVREWAPPIPPNGGDGDPAPAPGTADAAWLEGYTLGRQDIFGAPNQVGPENAVHFRAGYRAGRDEFLASMADWPEIEEGGAA